MENKNFKELLKQKMDDYVHFVYRATRHFPKEETYGSISQWKRSTLSIILNYIEGYARRRAAVQFNFYEISYGSFKESRYLLDFFKEEKFLKEEDYNYGVKIAEEIGAMLWTEICNLERNVFNKK